MKQAIALSVFALLAASFSSASERSVERYLFEPAVSVSLLTRADGTGGELCWCDTVTGTRGETSFVRRGRELLVEVAPGSYREAHRLADAALVLEAAPWGRGAGGRALGVALD